MVEVTSTVKNCKQCLWHDGESVRVLLVPIEAMGPMDLLLLWVIAHIIFYLGTAPGSLLTSISPLYEKDALYTSMTLLQCSNSIFLKH